MLAASTHSWGHPPCSLASHLESTLLFTSLSSSRDLSMRPAFCLWFSWLCSPDFYLCGITFFHLSHSVCTPANSYCGGLCGGVSTQLQGTRNSCFNSPWCWPKWLFSYTWWLSAVPPLSTVCFTCNAPTKTYFSISFNRLLISYSSLGDHITFPIFKNLFLDSSACK